MGPLQGVRVVDMTTVLMGPMATQMLGDMGADVIKVEAPEGDLVRQIGPMRSPGMGALFLNANRSKRSICLDLKNAAGREALLELAKTADVLVYNIRPQAMARLGLDYETLRSINSRLIYAGVYGFGQDGPYAAKPAYDDLIQGGAGLAALMARAGEDGRPRYVPTAIADRVVGLAAVGVICATLVNRDRTGVGQRIDLPMFETMVGFVMADHLGGLSFDPPLDSGGYARQLSAQRKPYRTRDGYVCALVYNDKQWASFLEAVGEADLPERDPAFRSFASRHANIDHVYTWLGAILETRTTAEWLELMDKADIPSMPMHDMEDLLEDPHLVATDFFQKVKHPSEGELRTMRLPARWSGTPTVTERLAPRCGADGKNILTEAGFDAEAIELLRQARALILPDEVAEASPRI